MIERRGERKYENIMREWRGERKYNERMERREKI